MKKNLLVLFCLLIIGGLQAQEVEEVQRSIITKKTATWCGFCGTWGWTAFEGAVEDNEDRAIYIGAHYSGDLQNPTSTAYMANVQSSGQPRILLNTRDYGFSSRTVSAKRSQLAMEVLDTYQNDSPMANANAYVYNEGNKLRAEVVTKFFQNGSGEYYTSILVLENDVTNNQASRGVVDHPFVLRGHFGNTTFGELITNGAVGAGQEFTMEISVDVDPKWDTDNLQFAVIVWQKVQGRYEVVNGTLVEEYTVSTSTTGINGINDFYIAPNIVVNSASIIIQADRSKEIVLAVHNLLGKEMKRIYSGRIDGRREFQISREDLRESGVYLVSLKDGDQIVTKRIMVE